MNDPVSSSPDAKQAMLFAQLVTQQTTLAMMLMGRTPNPQTGEVLRDLDSARLFIDQLEMIEAKTRGNLSAPEAVFLQQTLTTLRMAFVEAVNSPAPATGAAAATLEKETPPKSSPAA